jgi:hypothetical protein
MGNLSNWAHLSNSLTLKPDDPTHSTPWGNTYVLDIAVLKNIYAVASINANYGLFSGHSPVLIGPVDTVFSEGSNTIKMTHWPIFHAVLDENLSKYKYTSLPS